MKKVEKVLVEATLMNEPASPESLVNMELPNLKGLIHKWRKEDDLNGGLCRNVNLCCHGVCAHELEQCLALVELGNDIETSTVAVDPADVHPFPPPLAWKEARESVIALAKEWEDVRRYTEIDYVAELRALVVKLDNLEMGKHTQGERCGI